MPIFLWFIFPCVVWSGWLSAVAEAMTVPAHSETRSASMQPPQLQRQTQRRSHVYHERSRHH